MGKRKDKYSLRRYSEIPMCNIGKCLLFLSVKASPGCIIGHLMEDAAIRGRIFAPFPSIPPTVYHSIPPTVYHSIPQYAAYHPPATEPKKRPLWSNITNIISQSLTSDHNDFFLLSESKQVAIWGHFVSLHCSVGFQIYRECVHCGVTHLGNRLAQLLEGSWQRFFLSLICENF